MRTIVIGDVHGCLNEFEELVGRLDPQPGDRLVSLGDLMDKGPDPVGCVRFARSLAMEMVLGNHEEKHRRWWKHVDRGFRDLGYKNPMRPLKDEDQRANRGLSPEDVEFFNNLPSSINLTPGWVAVHGGLLPGLPFEKQPERKMIRVRWVDDRGKMIALDPVSPFKPENGKEWTEVYDGSRSVVFGHAVHSLTDPYIVRRDTGVETWGIDTGVVYGGRLTALVMETMEIVQVEAKETYVQPPEWLHG